MLFNNLLDPGAERSFLIALETTAVEELFKEARQAS
jgi:hypothetical protein